MKITLWMLAAAVTLASGCSSLSQTGSLLVADSVEQFRAINKEKIKLVVVGMSQGEVKGRMGSDKAGGGLVDAIFGRFQHLQVSNPMREELLSGADGQEYYVMFYYTDLRTKDDKITDDELTPVVLREGKVIGIGYEFLGARVPKYKDLR
jgi:hypothetical protein